MSALALHGSDAIARAQASDPTEVVVLCGCDGWSTVRRDEMPDYFSGVGCVAAAAFVMAMALLPMLL